ncbi:uncharacterized protein FOMMEDRAFT_162853 [Fomitiporia mediterranea MF3/22]|uniref:Uncharacterized protein n=1 Tax=Fomitiporia mediterranea (strain MF3/22) TaxID=694068 RepID=R7SFR4_FOMME|nr:uncharacterized protein FOMMEDRAFT_162853 [Fomitiporia mediterranea MF3/22]EJC97571.1 hypothetical protein FOMMEDRAFT_162853 [Fomitiporia mediterranea MF3/22]
MFIFGTAYTPYTLYTEVAYRIWVLLTQFTPVIIRAYAYTWEILRAAASYDEDTSLA